MTDFSTTTAVSGVAMAAASTAGVVVVIIGFIALGAALGLTPLRAGFRLLRYFGGVDMLERGVHPGLRYAVRSPRGRCKPGWRNGATGAIPALVTIMIAIFCQIRGYLPLAITRSGPEVQIVATYSSGVRPFGALSLRAKL